MSYDINLVDAVTKTPLQLDTPHQMRGGTYAIGGTTEARLNITYNYSKYFYRVFPTRKPNECDGDNYVSANPVGGIRFLYGMNAAESIPILDAAISQLVDDVDHDYWKPTEGNAKVALTKLRALACMRPDGVWDGD